MRFWAKSLCLCCLGLTMTVAGGAAHAGVGCMQGSRSSADCQYEVPSFSIAPGPDISKGIRLDAGTESVLFNSFPGVIPPYFISNTGQDNLFVPQNTAQEFQSFIDAIASASLYDIGHHYAIPPVPYTARPADLAGCVFVPSNQTVTVPQLISSNNPVILDGYTQLDARHLGVPSGQTTLVGPVLFQYKRRDCSADEQGNHLCVNALFRNTQSLLFRARGTAPDIVWDTTTPAITNILTASEEGGVAQTAPDCTISLAPVIPGVCGSADGARLPDPPSSQLCLSGNASAVTTISTAQGQKWGWTCYDVQGTATGDTEHQLSSGTGCGACQDKARQVLSACTAPCGGGTQTVTQYDGCGMVQDTFTQACNIQDCTSLADNPDSAGASNDRFYVATPTAYNNCYLSPSSQTIALPRETAQSVTIGPVSFSQSRVDCTKDNQSNRSCAQSYFVDTQYITLFARDGAKWDTDSPLIQNALTLRIDDGAAIPVSDCTSSGAPTITGLCGTNDGTDTAQTPLTDLCQTGAASNPALYATQSGDKWGWTCRNIKGSAYGSETQIQPTGTGCGACKEITRMETSACSAPCGGGTQTVTFYDGCSNTAQSYSQSCNTGSCYSGTTGDLNSTMVPYGDTVQSSILTYTGAETANVSVSGNGSPMIRINGGSWVTSATLSQGQTVQIQATAANADATTRTIVLRTGASELNWNITTANATVIYASYIGQGPHNCTSGIGGVCSNYYSCGGNMITCRVGTSCYASFTTPNPGECNCNDNYTWTVQTLAGSNYTYATMTNRCGSSSGWTPGLCGSPGTGAMCGYSGKLVL